MGAAALAGRRVAVLAANGVEQVELVQPIDAVQDAGADALIVSIRSGAEGGKIQAVKADIEPASTFAVDAFVDMVTADNFDALILPGGAVNPDKLRQDPAAVAFVRAFVTTGRPVAAICHAPWTLIEADVVRGRTLTSWPSLRTDLRNAGAMVVDQETVIDNGLITSRSPEDLPAFCRTIVEEFAKEPRPA